MIEIRPIRKKDLTETLHLLQQLSPGLFFGNSIDEHWNKFESDPQIHGLVAYDLNSGSVVAFGCLYIQVKIRGGLVASIEDVVCDSNFRRKGIASRLVEELKVIAIRNGCYKLTLQCATVNIPFYENCGFSTDGSNMTLIPDKGSQR